MSRNRQKKKTNTSFRSFDVATLQNPPSVPLERRVQSQQLSDNVRRRRTAEVTLPAKKRRRVQDKDAAEFSGAHDDVQAPEDMGDIVLCTETGRQRKRRFYTTSDEPLRDFQKHANEYMEEFVRVDGRGDAADCPCPTCPPGQGDTPAYRCTGCTGFSLYCRSCIIEMHSKRPFCTVEWDGECFTRTPLASLGLHIQLGHSDGKACEHPLPTNKDFIIMDITGIHSCVVYQCGCTGAPSLRQQLLRHRLFPASANAPRTACTFNLLEYFHHLTHQGKVTMYDFYVALEKMTDMLESVSTRSLAPMVFFCNFTDLFPVLYAYLQSYLCARALLPSATYFLGICRALLPRAAHPSLFVEIGGEDTNNRPQDDGQRQG